MRKKIDVLWVPVKLSHREDWEIFISKWRYKNLIKNTPITDIGFVPEEDHWRIFGFRENKNNTILLEELKRFCYLENNNWLSITLVNFYSKKSGEITLDSFLNTIRDYFRLNPSFLLNPVESSLGYKDLNLEKTPLHEIIILSKKLRSISIELIPSEESPEFYKVKFIKGRIR